MDISNVVAQKIKEDRELLTLLRNADPKAQINRRVLLMLNIPEIPKGIASPEELAVFDAGMKAVVTQAEQGFSSIEGLQVFNLMKSIGHASIGGTAEAVVKALELDCVENGLIGDREIFRGASASRG